MFARRLLIRSSTLSQSLPRWTGHSRWSKKPKNSYVRLFSSKKHDEGKEQKENFYELLGVEEDAKKIGIRDAYFKLAKQYHPDSGVTPNAELFTKISDTYKVLSKKESRDQYDAVLKQAREMDEDPPDLEDFQREMTDFTDVLSEIKIIPHEGVILFGEHGNITLSPFICRILIHLGVPQVVRSGSKYPVYRSYLSHIMVVLLVLFFYRRLSLWSLDWEELPETVPSEEDAAKKSECSSEKCEFKCSLDLLYKFCPKCGTDLIEPDVQFQYPSDYPSYLPRYPPTYYRMTDTEKSRLMGGTLGAGLGFAVFSRMMRIWRETKKGSSINIAKRHGVAVLASVQSIGVATLLSGLTLGYIMPVHDNFIGRARFWDVLNANSEMVGQVAGITGALSTHAILTGSIASIAAPGVVLGASIFGSVMGFVYMKFVVGRYRPVFGKKRGERQEKRRRREERRNLALEHATES